MGDSLLEGGLGAEERSDRMGATGWPSSSFVLDFALQLRRRG